MSLKDVRESLRTNPDWPYNAPEELRSVCEGRLPEAHKDSAKRHSSVLLTVAGFIAHREDKYHIQEAYSRAIHATALYRGTDASTIHKHCEGSTWSSNESHNRSVDTSQRYVDLMRNACYDIYEYLQADPETIKSVVEYAPPLDTDK